MYLLFYNIIICLYTCAAALSKLLTKHSKTDRNASSSHSMNASPDSPYSAQKVPCILKLPGPSLRMAIVAFLYTDSPDSVRHIMLELFFNQSATSQHLLWTEGRKLLRLYPKEIQAMYTSASHGVTVACLS